MKKCKYKYCGSEAIYDDFTFLTSNPLQYNVNCPKCGKVYMFCYECDEE